MSGRKDIHASSSSTVKKAEANQFAKLKAKAKDSRLQLQSNDGKNLVIRTDESPNTNLSKKLGQANTQMDNKADINQQHQKSI